MSSYDYIEAKKRLEAILDGDMSIVEKDDDNIPSDNEFTFENGYYGWVTAIFVDIRKSTELFNQQDKKEVARIIRCFSSEIIEILRKDENLRELGIRGDCVYAIYSTPMQKDVYNVADYSFWINTYIKMLNAMLVDRDLPTIKVGIGVATAKELVVKAGRKDVGINNKVWIGDAVTKASNLSSQGSKNGNKALLYSVECYNNFIDIEVGKKAEAKSWFTKKYSVELGTYYTANIIKLDFDEWILKGMEE